jgi:hypothetical protein
MSTQRGRSYSKCLTGSVNRKMASTCTYFLLCETFRYIFNVIFYELKQEIKQTHRNNSNLTELYL